MFTLMLAMCLACKMAQTFSTRWLSDKGGEFRSDEVPSRKVLGSIPGSGKVAFFFMVLPFLKCMGFDSHGQFSSCTAPESQYISGFWRSCG